MMRSSDDHLFGDGRSSMSASDADAAVGAAGEAAQVVFGALDLADDAPRGVEDAPSRGGQHHAASEPHEERGPHAPLDVPQLVLSADCVRHRRSAAAVIVPASAMPATSRRCRISRSIYVSGDQRSILNRCICFITRFIPQGRDQSISNFPRPNSHASMSEGWG